MTYMTKEEIWAAALRQSAVDLNCSPEDFGREHSVVVRSAPHAGARKYLSLPFFCDLVSYGGNVVASVAPEAEAAVRAYVERYAPEHCFETPNMNVLADALRPFGMRICFMAEYFLPDVSRMRQWDCGYALKVLGPADFAGLYRPEWSNALCEKRRELDVLAVGAYLCLIAAAVDGMDWYVGLALPITAAGALVIPLLYWIIRTRRCSLLVSAVLVLMAIGLFAVLTEFLCDEYLKGEWVPGWSVVVLASCAGLSIPLIIVRRVPSLREEARRRFHM